MEIKAKLNKPYTSKQRADFIVENNHKLGYEIKEVADGLEAWGMTVEEQEQSDLENMQNSVRAIRNQYLSETDKFMIVDYPITDEQREEYKTYRQYLRDYTKTDSWYEKVPITFEEFEATTEHASAKEVTEQIVTDEVDNGTV